MKKIETVILSLIAVMMAGMGTLYAQADNSTTVSDGTTSGYFWIIAIGVIAIGLIAAAIYRTRHRKDKTGSLTGDINNPASGI
ncbi:MAG: hypothetical protein JSS76_12095 [Bacteroidetes bacterium]|nr:hypothetical protein [Bacteroidota bacterium]MBS1685496.1 hypothetical protein [Bacteroidota bacterium]